MTIQQGDIKLKATQVMQDVPEGGGAPTSVVIPDGTSNAVYPDVSETDRALGRVNLRKVVVHVDSPGTEDYLGANAVVSRQPSDPNISITAFSTGDLFDTRKSAVARMEAYLFTGPQYQGYLFGNHIAGQSTLLLFQKTDALPGIGDTLVLTKREGYPDEHTQYVRVTEASAVLTTFEDDRGTYTRYVVTLKLQGTLDADYPGHDVSRFEITKAALAAATKISSTVVADAARYYGSTVSQESGSVGQYSLKCESIFAQLVPSSQIESPIADARTNQTSAAAAPSGQTITQTVNGLFTTTQNLFFGGTSAPGTVLISAGGVTVIDSGGRLMSAGTQVGTIDYDNGVGALTTNVFGTVAQVFTIVYDPGATPAAVNQSQGFVVTAANRALNYVRTIQPAPQRGTLAVSYMSQGRWYVLREQGDGALRGQESGYGAGNLNFTTGTVSVTLGALPDVGSAIIYTWVDPTASRGTDALQLDNDGKLYWPFNTAGASSLESGPKAIEPHGLSITWDDNGATRVATDDGAGRLIGDATGSVNYARGVYRLTPNELPAPGTPIQSTLATRAVTQADVSATGGIIELGVSDVEPGSVALTIPCALTGTYLVTPAVLWETTERLVTDDGAGAMQLHVGDYLVTVGSINYATGRITLASSTDLPAPAVQQVAGFHTFQYWDGAPPLWQNVGG